MPNPLKTDEVGEFVGAGASGVGCATGAGTDCVTGAGCVTVAACMIGTGCVAGAGFDFSCLICCTINDAFS